MVRLEVCDHEVLLVMYPVITEMSCASGMATTSSSVSTLLSIPRRPIKLFVSLLVTRQGTRRCVAGNLHS